MIQSLTDAELCKQMLGAWKYFYNVVSSGTGWVLGEKVSDLQALLTSYDEECKRRGIKAIPYTVRISNHVSPEMQYDVPCTRVTTQPDSLLIVPDGYTAKEWYAVNELAKAAGRQRRAERLARRRAK
jgi:hypothetical protein